MILNKQPFTILDEGHPVTTEAVVTDDTVFLGRETLPRLFGWELRREGLCRDGMCIVVPTSLRLESSEFGVDLRKLLQLLQRPLALDTRRRVAFVGTSAAVRAEKLIQLEAPDFTLPDLEGRLHSLSDYRGRKVILIAYASW